MTSKPRPALLHRVAVAGATAWLLVSSAAQADEDGKSGDNRELDDEHEPLAHRLGYEVADRWLKSEDAEVRRRGLERLGALGTTQALERLLAALEPDGRISSEQERLVAVRALAPHAGHAVIRQALLRLMTSAAAAPTTSPQSLEPFVRGSAALALACCGGAPGDIALGLALRQGGIVEALAHNALLAHPPADLGVIVDQPGDYSLGVAELLEALGDQRSYPEVRRMVQHGLPEIQAAAARALLRLGHAEVLTWARYYVKRPTDEPRFSAAADIVASGDPVAAAHVVKRLLKEDQLERALRIAQVARHPSLVEPLFRLAEKVPQRKLPQVFGILGRIPQESSVSALARAAQKKPYAPLAAYALSTQPHPGAASALAQGLRGQASANFARASAMRQTLLNDPVAGLNDALRQLLGAPDPKRRSAAAWSQALLRPKNSGSLFSHRDPAVVRAAARAAFRPPLARDAARALAKSSHPLNRVALAAALADPAAAELVPSTMLRRLMDDSSPAAPIATYALAARPEPKHRSAILAALHSQEPLLRVHSALGLGNNPDPESVAELNSQYAFEPSGDVRYAIVIALSRRTEVGRLRVLRLAEQLDPDPRVRHAASRALQGARLSPLPPGQATLWVDYSHTENPEATLVTALVRTPSGLAIPVVSDPDGVLTVAGLPGGKNELLVLKVGTAGL